MAGTATQVQGANAQSPQPASETPEVTEARAKSSEAGYARNRAEATYNAAKKEHGEKSDEAQAAKKVLVAAQVEVEKAQGVLRDLLKLAVKTPVAKAPKAEKPKEAKVSPKPAPQTPAPAEPPKAAYIKEYFESVRSSESVHLIHLDSEYIELRRVSPELKKELEKRVEELLKELKVQPKTLEYYRKQLITPNNGEMLLQSRASEMALPRHAAYLQALEAPKKN